MSALVSLVGAGPGDADLLTLKAVKRLSEADLVLYDGLVDPDVLKLVGKARRFYVGKRAGRKAIEQETINHLMIRAARRGERVVRLKCGDPFVLGRGGEEALALAEAGIPFEVVPGISSAVAGPALADIPVTHRGIASGFLVISGHSESAYRPILGSLAPGSVTVVVLMGLGTRASIAHLLLERGWPAHTPAAVVLHASARDESAWIGELRSLGGCNLPDENPDAPGVLIVGDVVGIPAAIAAAIPQPAERPARGLLAAS